jgi:hypothetical protein
MYVTPTYSSPSGGRMFDSYPTSSAPQHRGLESVPLQNTNFSTRQLPTHVYSATRSGSDSDPTLLHGHPGDNPDDSEPWQRPELRLLSGVKRVLSSMSKVPLFLRSSPAQGTGSYGALPVIRDLNFSSEAESSNPGDSNLGDVRRRSKRKGSSSKSSTSRRSRLRASGTLNTRDSSTSRYAYAHRSQLYR